MNYTRRLFLVIAVLLASCSMQEEKAVVSKYQSTKDGYRDVVPAYFLAAKDNSVCEVDSAQYVAAKRGDRVACRWAKP